MKRNALRILAAVMAALCLTGCGSENPPAVTENTKKTSAETEAAEKEYTANAIDTASASGAYDQKYTNVPGTPTQNSVLDYTFSYFPGTKEEKTYPITVLEPDELIVDALTDIYDFVQEEEVMPVRYFPEEVQKQVQEILKGKTIDVVDILHMTEFFGIQPEFVREEDEDAMANVVLDPEYKVGQLVVVMFGDTTDVDRENLTQEELKHILWTPLPAKVKKQGEISFEVPAELLEEIEKEETMFLVLTVRRGVGGTGDGGADGKTDQTFIPSKDSGDLVSEYGTFTNTEGARLPDDFRIFIQPHNAQTRNEIWRLQQFMLNDEEDPKDDLPIAAYFDELLQEQMALLLEDVQPDTLICYNANFLGAENYVETYGDVIGGFRFATPYPDQTQVVCLLGIQKHPAPEQQSTDPILPEESEFQWAVLRGEVKEGYVFITFPQQLIPVMEEEGALALVLSQPMTGEEEPEA